jgi:membrane protease YdiL (CAAX protease family)
MFKRNVGLLINLPIFLLVIINLTTTDFRIIPSENIFNIFYGIIIGIIIFPISLYICRSSIGFESVTKILILIFKNIFTKEFLRYCLITSCIEEYIWRYSIFNGILMLYLNKTLIAIISTLAFFSIHIEPRSKQNKKIINYIDIFIFSIILVALYYSSNSLLLVIGVHLARNTIILTLQKMALQ